MVGHFQQKRDLAWPYKQSNFAKTKANDNYQLYFLHNTHYLVSSQCLRHPISLGIVNNAARGNGASSLFVYMFDLSPFFLCRYNLGHLRGERGTGS